MSHGIKLTFTFILGITPYKYEKIIELHSELFSNNVEAMRYALEISSIYKNEIHKHYKGKERYLTLDKIEVVEI